MDGIQIFAAVYLALTTVGLLITARTAVTDKEIITSLIGTGCVLTLVGRILGWW